jgi:hypothetical protein
MRGHMSLTRQGSGRLGGAIDPYLKVIASTFLNDDSQIGTMPYTPLLATTTAKSFEHLQAAEEIQTHKGSEP